MVAHPMPLLCALPHVDSAARVRVRVRVNQRGGAHLPAARLTVWRDSDGRCYCSPSRIGSR
eukprot:scaffold6441_cov76-Phaeocystis_antarctica.AAC.1